MNPDFPDGQQPMTPSQKTSQARPKWSSGLESKLALIASIVSPYDYFTFGLYFYYFGGGMIFLPLYLLFLALIGIPMLLLEVGVGQFTGRGVWCAWNIAPLFKGLGYLSTIMNGQAAFIFFWGLMAQVIFCYDLGVSGPHEVSVFSHCPNDTALADIEDSSIYSNFTYDYGGSSGCEPQTIYSARWIIDLGSEGHHIPDGGQVLAMFLVIFLVCGIVAAGRRVIGVLSALCVLLPPLLMLMLMIRVLTMPGAIEGLKFGFYVTHWYRLLDIDVYQQAALMAIYTMGAGQGLTLTAASYNRFNNYFLIDCLLAVAVKVATIIITGVTVLGASGVLAHAQGTELHNILQGSFEMVAMVTEALLLNTPAGGFWTACFLVSFLLSYLIAAVWTVETTVMAVWDLLPHTPRFRQLRKKHVLVGVFAIPWLLYSIGNCTKGSWTATIQHSQFVSSQPTMVLICFLECAAVGWLYGSRRFQASWSVMQGGRCGCPFPTVFWAIITPIVLLILLILSFITSILRIDLPGLSSFVLSLLLTVISAVVLLSTRLGTLRQKWKIMTTPWDLSPYQMEPNYGRYETIAMSSMAN